jgi:sulfur transfer protein SufE
MNNPADDARARLRTEELRREFQQLKQWRQMYRGIIDHSAKACLEKTEDETKRRIR